jgi:hypothetical protein
MTTIIWHLLTRNQDYAFGRPALLQAKLRQMEICPQAPKLSDLRGGKPTKAGTSPDDYDIVLIVRDRHKTTSDHVLPDFQGATFEGATAPRRSLRRST